MSRVLRVDSDADRVDDPLAQRRYKVRNVNTEPALSVVDITLSRTPVFSCPTTTDSGVDTLVGSADEITEVAVRTIGMEEIIALGAETNQSFVRLRCPVFTSGINGVVEAVAVTESGHLVVVLDSEQSLSVYVCHQFAVRRVHPENDSVRLALPCTLIIAVERFVQQHMWFVVERASLCQFACRKLALMPETVVH